MLLVQLPFQRRVMQLPNPIRITWTRFAGNDALNGNFQVRELYIFITKTHEINNYVCMYVYNWSKVNETHCIRGESFAPSSH